MFIDFSEWKWRLVLLVSLAGNVFLGGAYVSARLTKSLECKIDNLEGVNNQLSNSLLLQQNVIDSYVYDRSLILNRMYEISENARKSRVVYRQADLPAPSCAPSLERVNLVNSILASGDRE